jgi:Zn-dependent membrane protease YugP
MGLYLLFLIVPLAFGLLMQASLKRTFARNARIEVASGLAGAEVARAILDANGLHGVPVEPSMGGPLSDHYDPRKRSVHLSEPVFAGRSVSASAVAAHEVGHAIQHAERWSFMQLRSAMFPAVAFASSLWIWLLLAGAFLNVLGLIWVALILFAVAVLFHFVTLPVEFDASRRAGVQLQNLGLVSSGEAAGVRQVLRAAALTYVAGALAALSQLLYYALVFLSNR